MHSLWWENTKIPEHEKLDKDIKTDVLIIGGGIAGVLCAYFLEQSGVDYVLVEADKICASVTKNTTAKITSQHRLIYDKLIKSSGEELAKMYLDANEAAVEKYKEICKNIDCDFEICDAYVYSRRDTKKIEAEIKALDKLHFNAEFSKINTLPFETMGAIRFRNQAQFNPIKFISSISKDLKIYEDTRVIELKEHSVITNHGIINAEKIIVATHFPFINKHGSYFLKMYQDRSYVTLLENAKPVDGMYIDEDKKGLSFRDYKNYLLIGGGSHRTGKYGGNWNELLDVKNQYYPNSAEKCRWAAQDCMTLDGIPYIGQYSKCTENFFVATGFNKWGMTSSMAAAMILTDMIMKKENPHSHVFSPARCMLKPQLAVNGFEAITNLLSFSNKRCPHLGCALKWNSAEHSWDCPCHGSRFDEKGNLLNNPATGDLSIRE